MMLVDHGKESIVEGLQSRFLLHGKFPSFFVDRTQAVAESVPFGQSFIDVDGLTRLALHDLGVEVQLLNEQAVSQPSMQGPGAVELIQRQSHLAVY